MVFHKMPYLLQLFAKNLVKTLKQGSLHKKLLVLKMSLLLDHVQYTAEYITDWTMFLDVYLFGGNLPL